MFKDISHKKLKTYIFVLFLLIVIVGIINMASISAPVALRDSKGLRYNGIVFKHMIFIFVPFAFFTTIFTLYSKRIVSALQKYWVYIYGINALLIFYVLFFGRSIKGARRWINLGPVQIQPSEFAKLSLIFALAAIWAYIYSFKRPSKHSTHMGVAISVAITLFYVIPIVLSRSLSSSLQLALIMLGIFLVINRINLAAYLSTVFGVGGFALIMIQFSDYRKARLSQTEQGLNAIRAIKRGHLFGRGYGNGLARNFYIPEVQTDYIFSAFTEEWGLIAAIVLILVYALLTYYIFYAYTLTNSIFEKLVIVGIGFMFFDQVLLHVIINTGFITTGVTLPFFSSGGSSIMVNMFAIFLVCAIVDNNDISRGEA